MKHFYMFALCGSFAYAIQEAELNPIEVNRMQYRFDDFNYNVYFVDSQSIAQKDFLDSKSLFASLSFITFSDFGLGANIDLHGQRASANVNTQILLNGVGLNMFDSSYGSGASTFLIAEGRSYFINTQYKF